MKKTLNYPELWQKKRNELPVNSNPDADWMQMSSLLDKQMPISGVIKKPFRFKIPKWGLHIFVGVSTVVAIYTGYKLYHSAKHHDLAVPDTQRIHRDSVAPAAKDTAPASNTIKPSTGISTVGGPASLPVNQPTFNTAPVSKQGQKTIDSINAPAMLSIPMHRDSAIVPIEVTPPKAARDSIAPVNLEKRDIQKDTSNTSKKPPKRKKRPKVNVFF